ncbi:alpha/beta hydrolase [Desulfosporosinus sp. OT]|uniref:alpha/beta hydrolase n=1 Tax=Desulfosporosinus sp. OT TaxID=913865 RepID=UPI000223A199|nr:alpha/beta hydrolase [Desulfosporosinus sp. OT]EGW38509.1 hydrolase of the alpha/beta superfamily [Desulfosporosinus sp. OT]
MDNLGAELRDGNTSPIIIETKKPWRKRLFLGFIGFVSIAVLGCIGISGFVGWLLTHPIREPVVSKPSEFGLTYQDVIFASREDNIKLSGWYIPAQNAKAVVIQAHGYAGSRTKEKPSFPVTQALVQQGISVLMFDFRASGESEGSLVSVGDFEQRDLQGAIDYVKRLGYQNIGIIGYSMGASTAAVVAANEVEIKSVVLDSPFADLKEYLQVNMPTWTKLPNVPFTPLILREIPVLTGITPENVSPVHEIEKFDKRPILFIAGDADDKIPMENSKELWEKVNNPKDEYWVVPGAKHVGAYSVLPDQYLEKVTKFFVKSLQVHRA